jgi:Fur family transcriptional regulator, peroxide stress response regulator
MKNKEKILERLKEKEVKITPQRLAIIDYLIENQVHPTAEKVYIAVRKEHPNISLATVYNTLEKLEEIQELTRLKVSCHNKIHYEYNLAPHAHFYCKECHQLHDILIDSDLANKNFNGHQVEEAQLCYSGVCKDCLEKTKKGEKK